MERVGSARQNQNSQLPMNYLAWLCSSRLLEWRPLFSGSCCEDGGGGRRATGEHGCENADFAEREEVYERCRFEREGDLESCSDFESIVVRVSSRE